MLRIKTSSIGSLNDDFLKMIYLAAKGIVVLTIALQAMLIPPGDDGLTEYGQRYHQANKRNSTRGNNEGKPEERYPLLRQIKDNFRIYFPTKETVLASKGGPSVSLFTCPEAGFIDDCRMEEQSAFSRSGTTPQLFLET